jgi:hypothetical protein
VGADSTLPLYFDTPLLVRVSQEKCIRDKDRNRRRLKRKPQQLDLSIENDGNQVSTLYTVFKTSTDSEPGKALFYRLLVKPGSQIYWI